MLAAVAVLDSTRQMLARMLARRARLLYISGSATTFVVVALGVLLSLCISIAPLTEWVLLALMGSLGAFVSVSVRGQPPGTDVVEDAKATFVYGALRACVAIAFSLIMYLAIKGGIFLSGEVSDNWSRILVLAFVAGFSEKLVPEAIIKNAVEGKLPR